jgi:hypothetical protein
MPASFPASMLNQNPPDLGILNRFNLAPSRSSDRFGRLTEENATRRPDAGAEVGKTLQEPLRRSSSGFRLTTRVRQCEVKNGSLRHAPHRPQSATMRFNDGAADR